MKLASGGFMIIDGKEFKKYDNMYYISADGDVYSKYSHKCLKHNIDIDGYHRVDIHQKHMKVHRLVYMTWVGPIDPNLQVNHRDDDKNNNNYLNLYVGSQADNNEDCIRNGHKPYVNQQYLIVRDKERNAILFFQPANKFFEYCNHSQVNGSISRAITRNWFKDKFEFINMGKSVTTIESILEPNIVSRVGWILSSLEAHRILKKNEDIVCPTKKK